VQAVFGSKTATKTTYVCIDCAHPYFINCYWRAFGECLALGRKRLLNDIETIAASNA